MILFPPAKINLGLHVVAKRTDGFHELETVFLATPLKDALEVLKADRMQFTTSGLTVSGAPEDNLCLRAYQLMHQKHHLAPVKIHLHKVIPMGTGLGGGSADAAYTLLALNELFELGLSNELLRQYAAQLGSDCAFFIDPIPHYASGRGEVLEPIAVDLSAYKIGIVYPAVHVNTGWAYRQITPKAPAIGLKEILKQPIATWKTQLVNDFEAAVFPSHPALEDIKSKLYAMGAVYACMSGSGSAFFGLFPKESTLDWSEFRKQNYFCFD